MINWKVRIKNKNFWLALVPAVLLLVQVVANAVGFSFDFGQIGNQLVDIINAVFGVLVILGVVNDPTTASFSDSELAMTYEEPKKK